MMGAGDAFLDAGGRGERVRNRGGGVGGSRCKYKYL